MDHIIELLQERISYWEREVREAQEYLRRDEDELASTRASITEWQVRIAEATAAIEKLRGAS